MSPSFLESPQDFAAFGTPGGSRIPSMNVLSMLEYLDGQPPKQWVATARVHHQYLPDVLGYEPGALTLQQQQRLYMVLVIARQRAKPRPVLSVGRVAGADQLGRRRTTQADAGLEVEQDGIQVAGLICAMHTLP